MNTISKYISYNEAIFSQTATRHKIDNTPNDEVVKNMKKVGEVFDKIREHFGKPIRVSSFFRCAILNKKIGGSKTSQHVTGEAIDIQGTDGITNKMLYDYIRENIDFDQLIWEYGTDKEPSWVHFSYTTTRKNRKQLLRIK